VANRTILYGAFKGFGDILSAAPTIISELESGSSVVLLIFPQLMEFLKILDFGPHTSQLSIILLPVPASSKSVRRFLEKTAKLSPDLIWISPHAVSRDASWKIPLLLWCMRKIFWSKALIAGADSEPGSRLFDIRVPINRQLPLMQREWISFSLATRRRDSSVPKLPSFVERIAKNRLRSPTHDVVFHLGASWSSKQWSLANCVELVERLSTDLRVVLLGLAEELKPIQEILSPHGNILFAIGSIEEAVTTISRSRVLITMDSGPMHFGDALNVATVSLFGPTNPSEILSSFTTVSPLYEEKLSCQPCWNSRCIQRAVYCMDLLSPAMVEEKVRAILKVQV
jgi:heptosyltransferase-2